MTDDREKEKQKQESSIDRARQRLKGRHKRGYRRLSEVELDMISGLITGQVELR
jgi:hypothetical protein